MDFLVAEIGAADAIGLGLPEGRLFAMECLGEFDGVAKDGGFTLLPHPPDDIAGGIVEGCYGFAAAALRGPASDRPEMTTGCRRSRAILNDLPFHSPPPQNRSNGDVGRRNRISMMSEIEGGLHNHSSPSRQYRTVCSGFGAKGWDATATFSQSLCPADSITTMSGFDLC